MGKMEYLKSFAKALVIVSVGMWIFYKGFYLPKQVQFYQGALSSITAQWLSRETEIILPDGVAHGKVKWVRIKVKLSKRDAYIRYKTRLQELHEIFAFLFK